MKIVYFIDHLRPDGSQRFLQHLVGGLAQRGHTQTIICLNNDVDKELIARLCSTPVDIHIIGKFRLACGYGLLSILQTLRRGKYDVAVTMLFYSDIVGRTLARIGRVPRIITSIRARDAFYKRWQFVLVGLTMRWADRVVLNSENVREFAIKTENAPTNRITVIPNGIQARDYLTSIPHASLCEELNLPLDTFLVGSVGRLTQQKGFDILIRAIQILNSPQIHVLFAGEGVEWTNLSVLAEDLGLSDQVHLIGYRRDVPRWLGALNLYVQPSRYEGMPNALLEAMAANCPIICTAVDGNLELVENGIHGWLVTPDDPQGLAETIRYAINNSVEAQRCGDNARQRVLKEFSIESMITAWENVLTC